jgi:hypothetical protein
MGIFTNNLGGNVGVTLFLCTGKDVGKYLARYESRERANWSEITYLLLWLWGMVWDAKLFMQAYTLGLLKQVSHMADV